MNKHTPELTGLNKTKITINDIIQLEKLCYEKCRQDNLYELRNEAKLRAVYSTQTYDEFKDIVDAAHLQPLNTMDKRTTHTKSRIWNTTSKK